MQQLELLSPAGNREKLEFAFAYGADAVYVGGKQFGLRAMADNFTEEELTLAVQYVHKLNKKIFVTLNIFADNDDLELMLEYVKFLEQINVDAVIVSDLGVFYLVKEHTNLEVHISTQASVSNWLAVKQWQRLGASRIVLAREVSIDNIKKIKDKVPDMDLEVFIHGAMCISVSGRCLLSAVIKGRNANKGACTHSCRWNYALVEETRKGEYFPIEEDNKGTYILNSKDLRTIEFLDKLVNAGISSFKIEGRMKSIYYTAISTKIYKQALTAITNNQFNANDYWINELNSISHREYTNGFYLQKPDASAQNYKTSQQYATHSLLAKVIKRINSTQVLVEVRNRIFNNSEIEFVTPTSNNYKYFINDMIKFDTNEQLTVAHPGTLIILSAPTEVDSFSIIRKQEQIIQ